MSESSGKFQESGRERRQRFRIDDTAILQVEGVTVGQAATKPAESFFSPSASFGLTRQLHEIEQENQGVLRTISDKNPDIAVYLNALDKKIDAIASSVAETILPENQLLQSIDLSEGGIGFGYPEKLDEGSTHAMKIWFNKASVGLYAYIQVVASNRAIDGGFHISATFHLLPDSERKIIAKHIMTVQAEQQRQRKAEQTQMSGSK